MKREIKLLLFLGILFLALQCACKKPPLEYTAQVYTTEVKYANYNEPAVMQWIVIKISSNKYVYSTYSFYEESEIKLKWSNQKRVWYLTDKFPLIKNAGKKLGTMKIPASAVNDILNNLQ